MHISEDADLRSIDTSSFPLCGAFEIEFDVAIEFPVPKFVDRSMGLEIEFSWWAKSVAQVGLMGEGDIPLGSAESPYWDSDQGWHMLIWGIDEMVYIAQGGEYVERYENYAAVPRSKYIAAWKRVVSAAASVNPE